MVAVTAAGMVQVFVAEVAAAVVEAASEVGMSLVAAMSTRWQIHSLQAPARHERGGRASGLAFIAFTPSIVLQGKWLLGRTRDAWITALQVWSFAWLSSTSDRELSLDSVIRQPDGWPTD